VRRLSGAALILAGTVAFTACLRSVAAGRRDVMIGLALSSSLIHALK
jgi:hypothetical protein